MIYKNIFKKLHSPIISKFCCNKKYPWGWMPQEYIKTLINQNEISNIDYKKSEKYLDTYYHHYGFCEGAEQAYKSVFKSYKNDENFLNNEYASPSLSLAINYLIENKEIYSIEEPKIKKINIINEWFEENHTFKNFKHLGILNDLEINHYILTGVIGPEMSYIYSQNPIKQIVKVEFDCENRQDVWLFERCLFEEESMWQIKNINNIIIEK